MSRMDDYDDNIDEEIAALAEAHWLARRRVVRARILLAVSAAGVAGAVVAVLTFSALVPPRPAVVRIAPRPLVVPAGPQAVLAWPQVRPGQKVTWVAVADPSARRLELSKDIKAGELVQDLRDRGQMLAQPGPPDNRFLITSDRSNLLDPAADPPMVAPGPPPGEQQFPQRRRVIDSMTGKTHGFVEGIVPLRFELLHLEGTFLFRESVDQYEIYDVPTAKRVAGLPKSQDAFSFLRAELAGPDKALVVLKREHPSAVRFQIWDWPKNRLLADVEQPCGTLSPGGRYLATLGRIGEGADPYGPSHLVIYDLKAAKIAGQQEVAAPPRPMAPDPVMAPPYFWNAIAFSADGQRLAALRSDGILYLWNFATGQLITKTALDRVWTIANRRTGLKYPIVVWDEDEPVLIGARLYSCRTGRLIRLPLEAWHDQTIKGYPAPGFVRLHQTDSRGRRIVKTMAIDTKGARRLDEGIVEVNLEAVPLAPVAAQAAKPGPAQNPVRHWPALNPGGSAQALTFAPSSSRALLVRYQDDDLLTIIKRKPNRLEFIPIDIAAGKAEPAFLFEAPKAMVLVNLADEVALTSDGRHILMVALEDRRTLEVCDLAGKKVVAWRPHLRDPIKQIAILKNGQCLVRTESDLFTEGSLSLWEWTPDKIRGIYRMPGVTSHVAVDPSRTTAVAAIDGQWRVFDAATGATLGSLDAAKDHVPWPLDRGAFSPDARNVAWLTTREPSMALIVWDIETGHVRLHQSLPKHVLRRVAWLDNDSVALGDVVFGVSRKLPIRWIPRPKPLDERSFSTSVAGRLVFVQNSGQIL